MMRTVYQNPGEPECGAACLAMLANVSIDEAKQELFRGRDPRRIGRKALLAALKVFGREALSDDVTRLSNKNRLRDLDCDALVYGAVIRTDGTESKHWLVWDYEAAALRDPLGFAQTLKLTSYTALT